MFLGPPHSAPSCSSVLTRPGTQRPRRHPRSWEHEQEIPAVGVVLSVLENCLQRGPGPFFVQGRGPSLVMSLTPGLQEVLQTPGETTNPRGSPRGPRVITSPGSHKLGSCL